MHKLNHFSSKSRINITFIFELIRNDIIENNYQNITEKTRSMLTNKIIAYIIVTDDKKENVIYSTEPSLINKNINYAKPYLQNYLSNNYEDKNTYYISAHINNKYIYIYFSP